METGEQSSRLGRLQGHSTASTAHATFHASEGLAEGLLTRYSPPSLLVRLDNAQGATQRSAKDHPREPHTAHQVLALRAPVAPHLLVSFTFFLEVTSPFLSNTIYPI